ncbi:MAG: hypothetical protein K6G44_14780 [Lentisphaeria bacterium]|nr:hypothetical protein [Lentisphaeria bacterium]
MLTKPTAPSARRLSSLRGGKGCHAKARGHGENSLRKNKKMDNSSTEETECLAAGPTIFKRLDLWKIEIQP